MPSKKSKNSDRPLKASEAEDVRVCIERAYEHIKLKPGAAVMRVQKAMRDVVDAVNLGKKKLPKKTQEDFGIELGCLWGQTVCDALGWEWCMATVDGYTALVVASRNRSHVVPVLQFMCTQVEKRPPEENTSLLLFNMLKARSLGSFGKAKAGAYVQVE
jgi:hypothetical protein